MTVALALPAVAVPMVGAGGATAVTVTVLGFDVPPAVVTVTVNAPAVPNKVAGSVTCADVRVTDVVATVCGPASPVTMTDTGA